MSDSVRPHRWQPTGLFCPWDSPGKNTGVGCHFLLRCIKVKSESEVAQSCPTLSDPMDCVAYQAPPSMGVSRQEYWSGVPLPSPIKLIIYIYICIFFFNCPRWHNWRRNWQPTPVFLPGESQGQRSLVGCSLWGCTESDTTEAT